MSKAPKQTEARLNRIITAWNELAPQAKFSGMTLAQFKTTVQPSLDHRESINTTENQLTAARVNRNSADTSSNETADQVVNSVKGDPNFGENSALYRAFGYVLKVERASGLTRKSEPLPAPVLAKAA